MIFQMMLAFAFSSIEKKNDFEMEKDYFAWKDSKSTKTVIKNLYRRESRSNRGWKECSRVGRRK